MTIRKKILVADASETIIAVCRKLLTQNGYDVTLFQDGTKALEELKRAEYDLAVIATSTQTCSGYFIVEELKKDRVKAQMPILMLLGSSELLDTRELVQIAPNETLSKPFSPQELLFKIDKLFKIGATGASDEPANDIESLLADDENSFEKKISSATDKIFLSMLKQSTTDQPKKRERPKIDKLDLTEDQYDVEAARPESKEEDSPHDYDWFIREMGGEEHRKTEAKPFIPPGNTGKFQVEEIGTTKISLNQLKKMQQAEEDIKTKVYIEKLNAPLEADTDLSGMGRNDSGKIDVKTQFLRFFAEALAKEIVKGVDFNKVLTRIEELTNVKQEK
ncbi:MAG: response regulator [Candidatus Zixiibacteriota bacterium]